MIRAGIVAAALFFATAAQSETIVVGTESGFPPIIFRDDAGQLTGRDKEIGDEICARAGWECEWSETSFDDLLPGIIDGRFDFVIAGMTASPQRREIVDFSIVYRPASPNTTYYAGLAQGIDPADSTISVHTGTTQAEFLANAGANVRLYPDNPSAFQAMLDGEVDLFFGGGLFLTEMVESGYDMIFPNGEESVPSWGSGIAVAKGRNALLDEINAAIQSMLEDGTIELLHNKWTGDGSDA